MNTTAPKFFCFVLMPFDPEFDEIYQYGIKEACKEAGAYCERVDEQIFHESILDRIYNQISKADLIIADMTGRTANVFYEVGYAHALGKPTVLLTRNADDIPFDLKHYPHIIYEGKLSNIRNHLKNRVEWFRTEGVKATEDIYKTKMGLYIDGKNLENEVVTVNFQISPSFQLLIHNSSARTYDPGEFKIGLINKYFKTLNKPTSVEGTVLPDSSYLHLLPNSERLYPDGYSTIRIGFYSNLLFSSFEEPNIEGENEFMMIIRIFTSAGSRDYKLRLMQDNKFPYDDKTSPF